MTNFWNGKKPKIALATLKLNKEDGGLGLVDLRLKDKAIKFSWLTMFNEDLYLEALIHKKIAPVLRDDIWKCNLSPKDIDQLLNKDDFWAYILRIWAETNFTSNPDEAVSLLMQPIWYNSCIRRNNQPFLKEKAYRNGLWLIAQLLDPNGNFIEANIICNTYKLSFLEYHTIKSALPKEWKALIKKNRPAPPNDYCFKIDVIRKKSKLSQFYYKESNCSDRKIRSLTALWKLMLKEEDIDLSEQFCNLYKITNYVKLRSFQYRILHNALILNRRLFQWGIAPSPKCTFCNNADEEIIHLFTECNEIKKIWYGIEQLLKEKYNIVEVTLTKRAIMFNEFTEKPCHMANLICLLTKFAIYKARCENKMPLLAPIIAQIRRIKTFELYNAKKNNKMNIFRKKWSENQPENSENGIMNYIEEYINEL